MPTRTHNELRTVLKNKNKFLQSLPHYERLLPDTRHVFKHSREIITPPQQVTAHFLFTTDSRAFRKCFVIQCVATRIMFSIALELRSGASDFFLLLFLPISSRQCFHSLARNDLKKALSAYKNASHQVFFFNRLRRSVSGVVERAGDVADGRRRFRDSSLFP